MHLMGKRNHISLLEDSSWFWRKQKIPNKRFPGLKNMIWFALILFMILEEANIFLSSYLCFRRKQTISRSTKPNTICFYFMILEKANIFIWIYLCFWRYQTISKSAKPNTIFFDFIYDPWESKRFFYELVVTLLNIHGIHNYIKPHSMQYTF